MSQLTYSLRVTSALAGMLVDPDDDGLMVESKINAAVLSAGLAVARDAADDAVKVPAAAADITANFMGITIRDVAREPVADGSTTDYAAGKGVSILTRGRIWVSCETAAAKNGNVFARYAAGAGGSVLGSIRNDVDTASAAQVPNARFDSTIGAAGLVIVKLF